jgi:outer membrane protein
MTTEQEKFLVGVSYSILDNNIFYNLSFEVIMYKTIGILTLILIFILSVNNVSAQKNKKLPIGIVDVTVIAAQLPESKEAEKKLQEFQKQISDSLAQMQTDFQKRVEAYMKQKGMMQPAEQQKQENAFRAEEQQLMALREQMVQELGNKRDEFLKPIRDLIAKAIKIVAKEEKLKLVLDKSTPIVLFSEDSMDITYKVLDRIKRGTK